MRLTGRTPKNVLAKDVFALGNSAGMFWISGA